MFVTADDNLRVKEREKLALKLKIGLLMKGVPTVIFFCHDRPRVGGPMCSTPPSGHYNIFKKIGLYGFFVAQQ